MSLFSFEKVLKIIDTILHILLGALSSAGFISKDDEKDTE